MFTLGACGVQTFAVGLTSDCGAHPESPIPMINTRKLLMKIINRLNRKNNNVLPAFLDYLTCLGT
jgi:hypothetical protein